MEDSLTWGTDRGCQHQKGEQLDFSGLTDTEVGLALDQDCFAFCLQLQ